MRHAITHTPAVTLTVVHRLRFRLALGLTNPTLIAMDRKPWCGVGGFHTDKVTYANILTCGRSTGKPSVPLQRI